MNALIRAAADLPAVCDTHQWRFCFIGGLAVLRWGEPRETVAVDLTLITGFGHESEFVSSLLDAFEPRIDDAADVCQGQPRPAPARSLGRRTRYRLRRPTLRGAGGIAVHRVHVSHRRASAHLLGRGSGRPQSLRRPSEGLEDPDLLERLERTRERLDAEPGR